MASSRCETATALASAHTEHRLVSCAFPGETTTKHFRKLNSHGEEIDSFQSVMSSMKKEQTS